MARRKWNLLRQHESKKGSHLSCALHFGGICMKETQWQDAISQQRSLVWSRHIKIKPHHARILLHKSRLFSGLPMLAVLVQAEKGGVVLWLYRNQRWKILYQLTDFIHQSRWFQSNYYIKDYRFSFTSFFNIFSWLILKADLVDIDDEPHWKEQPLMCA